MKTAFYTSVSAFGLLLGTPAYAQNTLESSAEENDENTIVVIAQRREQDLQDVPIAISVFGSEERDKIGIQTIQDMSNFTPGLSYSASLERLSIRGVGRLTNIIGTEPGVATYNDGFYTASPSEASKSTMFVERVEVLRGPQGTLYGRNSIGGSLNVISKRPTDYASGEFRVGINSSGFSSVEGFVSGPITDSIRGRVSAQVQPQAFNFPYDNISGLKGENVLDRFLVEAQLEFDLSDSTELWLKYSHAEWDDSIRPASLATPYTTTNVFATGLVPNAAFGYNVANPGVTDPFAINTNTRSSDKLSDNHNIVANLTHDFGGVTVKYVGGYSQYVFTQLQDLDNTAQDLVTTFAGTLGDFVPGFAPAFTYTYNPTYVQEYIEDKKYYSNEITLSNTDPGRFNWIAGLYQYYEKFSQPVTQFIDADGTDNLSAAIAAPICSEPGGTIAATCALNPRRAFYAGVGNLTTKSYAAFGQADYEVTDGLRATVGLRYSKDIKDADESYRIIQWDPTDPDAACFGFGCGPFTPAVDVTGPVLATIFPGFTSSGAATRDFKDNWKGLSWRFGLDYKPNDDTLLFGSYSRGLKSGGYNLGSFSASSLVDKEVVDTFELGFKSRPMDSLTFNVSGFHSIYKDVQVPITVVTAGIGLGNLFNVPQSQSTGVEVETRWNATDWLEINANYAYLDARITKTDRLFDDPNIPGNMPIDIDGNRMPASSKHKISISGLIDVPISQGNLFLAGSYVYRSDAYFGVFDNPNYRVPGWDQVDLRVTYVTPDENIRLIGYVRNVFDNLGFDGAFVLSQGGASASGRRVSYTPARNFGIELQAKF
jgi:iron complex outermembrane receptor protein